jgi:homocysteine S-methyltransferase
MRHPGNQSAASGNPLELYLGEQSTMILDGGLATALEASGHDLRDPLWSAKTLIETPDAIRDLHYRYLVSGADCVTTATYQATLPGFRNRGLSEKEGIELLRLAVRLACEARESFWAEEQNRTGRLFPIVAASVGPYGAYLADGSEYTGDYDISDSGLYEFHRGRWRVLSAGEADLLACETIPSGRETAVLLRLLRETPDCFAWMSFSCRDKRSLCDGTPLREVVRSCSELPNVAAVGINCTAPVHVSSLIAEARDHTDKPVIVYPNLGERYNADTKSWGPGPSEKDWLVLAREWMRLGAAGVGGCCRIGPEMIRELRRVPGEGG